MKMLAPTIQTAIAKRHMPRNFFGLLRQTPTRLPNADSPLDLLRANMLNILPKKRSSGVQDLLRKS